MQNKDNLSFPFDPGFIGHLYAFVPSIEAIYSNLSSYSNFNHKKAQFRMQYPKVLSLIKDYMAFYFGCILWAMYITNFKGADILNNLCFGMEYDEEETLTEVNFIKNYLELLKKDVKYYLGQDFKYDERYPKIIEAYSEFLKLNEGFVKVQKTDDIKLPSNLKIPKDMDFVRNKIEESVENGLACLLELFDMVL